MTIFTIFLWSFWFALVVFALVLRVYRARLTRDEDDELFLGEAFAAERAQQAEIAAKAAKIEPAIRLSRWLVVIASVILAAYYVYDFLVKLQLI